MPCETHQRATEFFMEKDNIPAALQAVKDLKGYETCSDSPPHFSWVSSNFADKNTFESIMSAWRWSVMYDKEGNVIDIDFKGENLGDDALLLSAIAPFVEEGSYICIEANISDKWTWTFKNAVIHEER